LNGTGLVLAEKRDPAIADHLFPLVWNPFARWKIHGSGNDQLRPHRIQKFERT
jgi:hypothetical protein